MGYNTKIKIDDQHVEQLSGATLTLSGNTVVPVSGSITYGVHPSSFTNLDLVDKQYVDGASGAIGGANGLDRAGDNIVLGGDLTVAPVIIKVFAPAAIVVAPVNVPPRTMLSLSLERPFAPPIAPEAPST